MMLIWIKWVGIVIILKAKSILQHKNLQTLGDFMTCTVTCGSGVMIWYGSYATVAVTDPIGLGRGSYQAVRGGSFGDNANKL